MGKWIDGRTLSIPNWETTQLQDKTKGTKKEKCGQKRDGSLCLIWRCFLLQALDSLCVHVLGPWVSERLWHVSDLFSSSYCRSRSGGWGG